MKIDPNTGLVNLIDIKTGKLIKAHPVDAKEQLSFPDKERKVRLADVEEVAKEEAPLFDFSRVSLALLRSFAQEKGITWHSRPRKDIEVALEKIRWVPSAEELKELGDG